MQNDASCTNCWHSLESHPPDFGTRKMRKCVKCDCEDYRFPL